MGYLGLALANGAFWIGWEQLWGEPPPWGLAAFEIVVVVVLFLAIDDDPDSHCYGAAVAAVEARPRVRSSPNKSS